MILFKIKRPNNTQVFQEDLLSKEEFFLMEGWYNILQIEDKEIYHLTWYLDSNSELQCYKVGERLYSEYFGCYFNSQEEFDRAWKLKAFA